MNPLTILVLTVLGVAVGLVTVLGLIVRGICMKMKRWLK